MHEWNQGRPSFGVTYLVSWKEPTVNEQNLRSQGDTGELKMHSEYRTTLRQTSAAAWQSRMLGEARRRLKWRGPA